MNHYNLIPFQRLLTREDPLELIDQLDEILFFLVQFSEQEGKLDALGHRYYLLRSLRNTIRESIQPAQPWK